MKAEKLMEQQIKEMLKEGKISQEQIDKQISSMHINFVKRLKFALKETLKPAQYDYLMSNISIVIEFAKMLGETYLDTADVSTISFEEYMNTIKKELGV